MSRYLQSVSFLTFTLSFPLPNLTPFFTFRKHIFLLGPSHHLHLPNCALSGHTHYATPLGDIPLDIFVIRALRSSGLFRELSTSEDAAEHSLEMHLPYIQQLLLTNFPDPSDRPPLTPIMVGATSKATERQFGQLLAPYLSDPTTIFIISSDFCHWGTRFDYTYYLPRTTADIGAGVTLHKSHKPTDPPVHESIRRIDQASMDAVETGSHDAFVGNLAQTQNTVCGRHPIGVMMAAMEAVLAEQAPSTTQQGSADGKFRFVRYERSSDVVDGRGSSVSYASAYAVFDGA